MESCRQLYFAPLQVRLSNELEQQPGRLARLHEHLSIPSWVSECFEPSASRPGLARLSNEIQREKVMPDTKPAPDSWRTRVRRQALEYISA